MIRPLRSVHCEKCGVCVTKYSKHSIFLNRCIGAGNELLYMVLQLAIIITVLVILNVFVFETLKGWLAFKILFYFINAHLQLQCIIDALELLIYVRSRLSSQLSTTAPSTSSSTGRILTTCTFAAISS